MSRYIFSFGSFNHFERLLQIIGELSFFFFFEEFGFPFMYPTILNFSESLPFTKTRKLGLEFPRMVHNS